jgi:hypothetical protein
MISSVICPVFSVRIEKKEASLVSNGLFLDNDAVTFVTGFLHREEVEAVWLSLASSLVEIEIGSVRSISRTVYSIE